MKVIESRRGNTSHQANPWFAIDEGGRAGRESTAASGSAPSAGAATGDWPSSRPRISRCASPAGSTISISAIRLAAGESLETPPFYARLHRRRLRRSSRMLHRFERDDILPGGALRAPRPVLYNSWEATKFAVDEPGQKALAEKAAKLGVELFVMDDGWFGARNDDHAGLGDWTVNPKKFPNGLTAAHRLRQQAGHGFRPVGRARDGEPRQRPLPRSTPTGPCTSPAGRAPRRAISSILNMARDDVKNYIFGVLDKLLSENQHRVPQMGHEPPLRRARLAGGAGRRAEAALGEIR